jgi:hypothetical protein
MALVSQWQGELARVSELANRAGKRLTTLSIESKLRFRSPLERQRFAEELQRAVFAVFARHAGAYVIIQSLPGKSRASPEEELGSHSASKRRRRIG